MRNINRMKKKTIRLDCIDALILFGGGELLVEFAEESIGRGMKTYIFAVKRHLEENIRNKLTLEKVLRSEKIPFFCCSNINKSKKLRSIVNNRTIGVGLGEAYTFDKNTIALFKRRLFDFMTIKLPQYRGGAHFTWQILRKSRIGAWNIQVINEEMIPGIFDSGEILKVREYKIPENVKIPADYYDIANREGLKLFKEFLDDIDSRRKFRLKKISGELSTYFPRLFTLKHGFINWGWNTDEIERFICAFDKPYPGASTFICGKKVFLKACRMVKNEGRFHPFMSGLIYRVTGKAVFVAINDGSLEIKSILDERGNNITHKLKSGQRFYTPCKYLEAAMLFQAEYNDKGLVNKI